MSEAELTNAAYQELAAHVRRSDAELIKLRAENESLVDEAIKCKNYCVQLSKTINKVAAKNAELRAENDRLKGQGVELATYIEDAERYRWLRVNRHEIRMWSPNSESNRVRAWLSGKQLDDAIDCALRGEDGRWI